MSNSFASTGPLPPPNAIQQRSSKLGHQDRSHPSSNGGHWPPALQNSNDPTPSTAAAPPGQNNGTGYKLTPPPTSGKRDTPKSRKLTDGWKVSEDELYTLRERKRRVLCPATLSSLIHFFSSGGATAIIASVQPAAVAMSWRLIYNVLISSLVMLGWAMIINNVGRRRWPTYWFSGSMVFVRKAGSEETEETTDEMEMAIEEGRSARGFGGSTVPTQGFTDAAARDTTRLPSASNG
ncbi:hypothetical protein EMMF5_001905 [Cystobasidiomycetes sp. EMM_F5]